MPGTTIAHDPIPILRGTEEDRIRRITKMCGRLEVMFHDLFLIQNVLVVCVECLKSQNADNDLEVAAVLTRCADDKIHEQLERLHKIVKKLGGETDFSDMDNEGSTDAITPA